MPTRMSVSGQSGGKGGMNVEETRGSGGFPFRFCDGSVFGKSGCAGVVEVVGNRFLLDGKGDRVDVGLGSCEVADVVSAICGGSYCNKTSGVRDYGLR